MKGKYEIMKEWRRDNKALSITFVALAVSCVIALIAIL